MRRSLFVAAGLAAWLVLTPLPPAFATAQTADARLPVLLDADGDGWLDIVEDVLGSDPSNPSATPEDLAIPESCMNAGDDDLDGKVDERDAGCRPDDVSTVTFPAEGADAFDSTMTLTAYDLATPGGVCPIDFDGSGPVVVSRSTPADLGGGLRGIDTEIVAMQLNGTGTLLGGSPCNPGATPMSFPTTVYEDPAQASTGSITDTNADPARDFPADSFFDVHFRIETPLGTLDGGPPGGPAGAAVQVTNTVGSIPPYHSPANPKLNPNCYTVAGLPHQHCPKPPLDHFKCYSGEFATFTKAVTLKDQFLTEEVKVRTPNRFCNPVSKNAQGIFDDGGHLERYAIAAVAGAPTFQSVDVVIQNQFGLQPMTVTGRNGLFVPTRKDTLPAPLALDHFKCYSVQGAAVGQRVRLEDQFDVADGRIERARVLRPVTLCNPVEKTVGNVVSPVGDASMHLVCYAIETQAFRARTVLARNQFGKAKVRVRRPVELCAPSLKTVVPDIEVDVFPTAVAQVGIQMQPQGETVELSGSVTMRAQLGGLADTDGDGLEQVPIEIVQLNLTGGSTLLGPITLRARDPSADPQQHSTGEIEESDNLTPGVLDLPPFAPSGQATSSLSLFVEMEKVVNGQPIVLHGHDPILLTALITFKPCGPGEAYLSTGVVQLFDEHDQPVPIQLGQVVIVPLPL